MGLLLPIYGKKLGASALLIEVIFSAFSVMISPRIIMPTLNSFIGLAVLWSLLALCFAAGDPAEQALVSDLTGGDQRGRAYGLYVMASDIGAALGPLCGGWLYDVIDPSAPFLANGVMLALCGLLLLIFLQILRPIPYQETAT